MESLFLKIFELAVTSSYLIVAVVVLRLLLKRAPRWITCLLWGFVALRLICPFSIESVFSLIPEKAPVEIVQTVVDPIPEKDTVTDIVVIPEQPDRVDIHITYTPPVSDNTLTVTPSAPTVQISTPVSYVKIFSYIWIAGACIMALYCVGYYLILRVRVFDAVRRDDGIWQSEKVNSPFILGILRPRIYLPFNLSPQAEGYVIAHEKAHIRRLDHLAKPFGFALLCLYWFNPLVWVAYILFCKDIEGACDERVIKDMDESTRKAYATALLDCCISRKSIAACPLAFGESDVKKRVKKVVNYKKVTVIALILALLCVALFVGCFMTDPFAPDTPDEPINQDDPIPDDPVDPIPDDPNEQDDVNVIPADTAVDFSDLEQTVFMVDGLPGPVYANESMVVLSDNYGVIVYDLVNNKVSFRITREDMENLGGLSVFETQLSATGRSVYLGYDDSRGAYIKYPYRMDIFSGEIFASNEVSVHIWQQAFPVSEQPDISHVSGYINTDTYVETKTHYLYGRIKEDMTEYRIICQDKVTGEETVRVLFSDVKVGSDLRESPTPQYTDPHSQGGAVSYIAGLIESAYLSESSTSSVEVLFDKSRSLPQANTTLYSYLVNRHDADGMVSNKWLVAYNSDSGKVVNAASGNAGNIMAERLVNLNLSDLNADYLARMRVLGMDMSDIPNMTEHHLSSNLIYISDKKAVLSGNFGIIVYDMAEQRISSRLSYQELGVYGIHYMNFEDLAASLDGRYVYISYYNVNMVDYSFVYDTVTNEISLHTQEVGTVVRGGYYQPHDDPSAVFSEVGLRYNGGNAYLMFDNGMTADGKIVVSDANGNLTFYPIFNGLISGSGSGSIKLGGPCSAKGNVDLSDPAAKTVVELAEDFYENYYINADNDLTLTTSDAVARFLEEQVSYGFDGSMINNFTIEVNSLAKHSVPSLGIDIIELELYYSFNYGDSESLSAGISSVYALYDTKTETVINIGISWI